MKKDGYSHKGFFGETIHYDENGRKVGESVRNFAGTPIYLIVIRMIVVGA